MSARLAWWAIRDLYIVVLLFIRLFVVLAIFLFDWLAITTPFKQACATIFHLSQNPRWSLGVKGPKSTKFDLANHISAWHLDLVYQIWTKFGMNILLDPTNKFAQEFLIYHKIQDGRQGSKVQN